MIVQGNPITPPMKDLNKDVAEDLAGLYYDPVSSYLYVLFDTGGVVGVFERESSEDSWVYVTQFVTPYPGTEGIALRKVGQCWFQNS